MTIRTKLQIKYRATLYQHEIKEQKIVMPILFPLMSPTCAVCHTWNLSRLGSHDWIGEGLTQQGQVSFLSPPLNLYYLDCPGLDYRP